MPNSVTTSSPQAQRDAVARLLYHCAVVLDSDFEAGATTAFPSVVPERVRTFFNYASGNYEHKSSYTSANWYSRIAAFIDQNLPVFYGMWQADGSDGHAVVCDGYRNGNEIHLNLGWSGNWNAWYNIDTIIASGYTWTTHSAVFGITPPGRQPPAYTLQVQSSGASGIMVGLDKPDVNGFNAGTTPFSVRYLANETVTLSAATHNGAYSFSSWSGDIVSQNDYYAQVLMNGSKTVTANYTPSPAQPGTYLSINAYSWDDSSGDNDGVVECSETIKLRVRLYSSANVSSLSAILSSSLGSLNISDFQEDYPDIGAGSTAWPNSDFDMVLNLANESSVPFTLNVSYLKGGLEYYQTFTFNKTFYPQNALSAALTTLSGSLLINDSTNIATYNNGDGIIQSGERVTIQPKLKNTGQAGATDIQVWLTYSGTAFTVNPNEKHSYPDLDPGQESYPLSGATYSVREIREDFTGCENVDVHITYSQSPDEVVIPGGVQICVQAAPWLLMPEGAFDFGVAVPGSSITHTTLVQNFGSAVLQITNITTSASDTTWVGPALPWALGPGQSTNLALRTDTTGLQGQISRQVQVFSTGRVHYPGDDVFTMSGMVSDTVPVYQVPNVTGASHPDISGDWIVWADGRNGNSDIYAYNLATGQEKPICTNSANQWSPFISGNLIVWNDWRNFPTNSYADVYAYDLARPDLDEFPVLLSSGHAKLIGVDGNLVAVENDYYTFTERSNWHTARNLIVYQYQGNGQFTQVFQTGFTSNASNNPMQTIDGDGSFGGGLLVVQRAELWWHTGVSNPYWDGRNQRLQVINFAVGENTLRDAVTSSTSCVSATTNRFVYQMSDTSGDEQIYLWRTDGSVQQMTSGTPGYADDVLGIGGPDGSDCVVYDIRDSSYPGLYYLDRSNGQQYTISTSVNVSAPDLQMDDLRLVFVDWPASSAVKYVFLKQPDVQVTSPGITFSQENPLEGTPINISVLVRNLSSYNQPGTVMVNLYDGDPDNGGTSIATGQAFSGLSSHSDLSVVFSNIMFSVEGVHNVFAKLTVSTSDPAMNNKASRPLTVIDSDTQPPSIANVSVLEVNGDGDGIIGADEDARVDFIVTDASGVTNVQVLLDGTPKIVSVTPTNYSAFFGELSQGTHQIEIRASDMDDSPLSVTNTYSFSVVAPERMSILCGYSTVFNGQSQAVDLGTSIVGSSPSTLFILRNDGQQSLLATQLAATGPFSCIGPVTTNVSPNYGSTTFIIRPSTAVAGTLTGTVTIASSDPTNSPFSFPITATVLQERPRLTGIQVLGQFVELTFTAATNSTCLIQWSTDLTGWTNLATLRFDNTGSLQYYTPVSSTANRRFYRLSLQ